MVHKNMTILLLLILFQDSWWTSINPVYIVLIALVTIATGLIMLLSRNKDFVQLVDKETAKSTLDLVKTRDIEIADYKNKNGKLEEELADTTAEFRALAAIDIEKLVQFWKQYEDTMAYIQKLEERLRIDERAKKLDQNK
jgi:hypothetical protein